MTAQQSPPPPARTIRLLHAAMVVGVLLFALVGHFVLRPTMANSGDLPAPMIRVLFGVSLGATALALLLRKRIPKRSTDESADLFWATATAPALLTWAPLELGSLVAVFAYTRTGLLSALGVAAVVMLLLVVLNPAYLERC